MSQGSGADGADKWLEILNHVNEEMPVALDELEDEFRRLLGDEG